MSLRPFSSNELEQLKDFIGKNGFKMHGSIENYFRYSLRKDKLVLFTIKLPVTLPVRLNIPFEVVSFRLCLVFKFWDLNQNVSKDILSILRMLRGLVLKISLEHDFPVKGKEKELLDFLNLLMPETIRDEKESAWLNRIRISILNKKNDLSQNDSKIVQAVNNTLSKLRLNPTFKLPWELKEGVPKFRTSESLFFSNEESYDEFFILEKGYFSYFKDLEFNKFYIRSHFDCYTPYLLDRLFNDPENNIEIYLENWIKFSRVILNSVIDIINLAEINQADYMQFNYERDLQNNDFEQDQNNFPFTALHYESSITKTELYKIHNDLFNSPPTNFEVIESINTYTEAEDLIKNYRFDDAAELLNQSLKIFNKNRQKKIVVSVLLKLYKIANILGQNELALNYLQSALGVAKSGEVAIEFVLKIHYKLGKWYYSFKKYGEALNHFNIIINFLENELTSKNRDDYLGLAYIYAGLINQEENRVAEAKSNYKKAFQLLNRSIKVKLKYYLLRAKFFKEKGYLSQVQKMLRTPIDSVGLDFDDKQYEYIFLDLILELIEFYIHSRVDSRKAIFLLKKIEKQISINLKHISGIQRSIRWNLLMCDYYDLLIKDSNKSAYYYKQSQVLSNQLKKIGVLN
ncbi:MAG: tetratricopeptide repeat protein [Candidatus Thorarchaeota archaeon]